MGDTFDWKDVYVMSEDRKVLVDAQIQIPGLQVFGHHNMRTALPPLPNHYHYHCMEITYVAKGVLHFSVSHQDYELSGGDVFISFADEVHSTDMRPLTVGEIYWMQINVRDYEEIFYLNKESSRILLDRLLQMNAHHVSMGDGQVRTLLKNAFSLCLEKKEKYLVASYISLFLQLLLKEGNRAHAGISEDIEASVAYIRTNVRDEISLEQLAGLCGLSLSQYKQKFKKQMGISPRNYINLQKIELAKEMIRDGYDITDTAMALGFSTSSYFSVVFKKYTACSPIEYSRKYGKE